MGEWEAENITEPRILCQYYQSSPASGPEQEHLHPCHRQAEKWLLAVESWITEKTLPTKVLAQAAYLSLRLGQKDRGPSCPNQSRKATALYHLWEGQNYGENPSMVQGEMDS